MQVFATRKATAMAVPKLTMLLTKYRYAVRVMKLTAILLLVACLQLSARGLSQSITLSLKDVPIQKVFKEIERQTDFTFFADNQWLKKAKKVTVVVKSLPLSQVLELCFKDQPFSYSISGKTITLGPKKEKVEKENKTSVTQNPPVDIKGRVVNSKGEPISDATVSVQGSIKRTVTNANGEFSLAGVDDNAIIIISHVQYETSSLSLSGNNSVVNATLQIKVSSLDEMQVIAYGTTTKRLNTGNVSTIKSTDIEKQPINNPLLALQGRVPGMIITQQNGLPGTAIKVQIRGQNSLQNSTLPFFIIDGVPYLNENLPNLGGSILGTSGSFSRSGNPLSFINPSDIESIDVLKDADATAIYGSRGANGVVLITTKKGKPGKLRVDANFQTGFGKVPKKIPLLNTEQYLEMRREAFKNDGINNIPASAYDLKSWDSARYTDWQKELIGGTSNFNEAQLSLSGGSNSTTFFVGGTYRKETTVFPGDLSNQQGSLHLNLNTTSLNQKFSFALTSSYSVSDNRLIKSDFTGNSLTIAPNAPRLYNEDGTLNWEPNPTTGFGTWTNPIAAFISNKFKSLTNNLISNAILKYQIVNGLEIKASIGYNNLQSNEKTIEPAKAKDPSYWQFYGSGLRRASFSNNRATSWIVEPQISYNKAIFRGQLSVLIGSTIQQNKNNSQQINAEGFSSDLLIEDPSFATNSNVGRLSFSEYKYNAVFGRLSYNWGDKYLINVTARRDGTSRFGPAKRFHNFSAVGVGWVFSKEKIVQNNLDFLSFGKIRASYGTTGSDGVGDYAFMDLYSSTSVSVPYQSTTGLQLDRLFTPDLAWEETKKAEVGLELGFLRDRILVTASHYKNQSSNQLTGYALPYVAGFSSISKNLAADIRNTGWEFTLNTINISSNNFKWSSSFNLFWNRNKLINIDTLSSSYKQFIGRPLGSYFVWQYAGVNPTTGIYEFIDSKGNAVSTGLNGATDLSVLIDNNPKFSGGFLNTIQFKEFQLDFLLQFVKQTGKNYMYNHIPGNFGDINYGNQPVTVLNRWQKPGDVTDIQRYSQNASIYTQFDYAVNSNQFYSDISFIKLKNVSLSWQTPGRWKQLLHLRSSRLYVQGQNLLIFTKYKGFDPETRSVSTLPPLRVITAGIQIGL